MSQPTAKGTRIGLSFPTDPEMWILARMGVSAIAAQLDFGIEAVEDLRLAVNELCSTCAVGATVDSRIELDCTWGEDSVEVSCRVDGIRDQEAHDHVGAGTLGEFTEAELSRRILAALVDEHQIESPRDGVRRAWFRKERVPAKP